MHIKKTVMNLLTNAVRQLSATPELVPLLEEMFPDAGITIDVVRELPIDPELRHFEESEGYSAWRRRLSARELDRILLVLARVDTTSAAPTGYRTPTDEIAATTSIA